MCRKAHLRLALVALLVVGMTGIICAQSSKSSSPPPKPAPAPARPVQPAHQPHQPTQAPPSKGQGSVQQHTQPIQPRFGSQEPSTAAHMFNDLNVQRSHMQGINHFPIQVGTISLRENGTRVIVNPGGRRYEIRPDGSITSFRHGNTAAAFRPDGTLRLIQAHGMTIARGLHGEEHFDAELPGGERVVGWGSHDGYVERPLQRGDGHYVQRTYVLGGRRITGVYRTFIYQGMTLARYVPDRRFSPAFYAWALRPWPGGIHYAWPWRNEPWAAPYRHHFDREYRDSAEWLADYLLATTLQQSQASSAGASYTDADGFFYAGESAAANTGRTPDLNEGQISTDIDPITSAVTAPIEDQTRIDERAMAQEATAPSSDAQTDLKPAILDTEDKLYIVNSTLSVNDGHVDCTLTWGTILKLAVLPQNGADTVEMVVIHSNPGDCTERSTVPVHIRDLQEMRNNYYDNFSKGSQTLQASVDKSGLLARPSDDVQMVPQGQPDPALTSDATSEIMRQEEKARTIEQEVTDDVSSGSGGAR
jgi:hypothetical protein